MATRSLGDTKGGPVRAASARYAGFKVGKVRHRLLTGTHKVEDMQERKMDFKEEQRFIQWWLWMILIGIGVLPIFGIYKQLILGEPFGDKPMSDFWLVVFSLFVFALIGLFILMKLKTEINHDEIRMTFVPFVKKRVKWNEIREAKVLDYGFVGGWGIRYSTRYGTVYNVKGHTGLAIELINGKKFLIGTQKEEELKEMIQKVGFPVPHFTSPKAATS